MDINAALRIVYWLIVAISLSALGSVALYTIVRLASAAYFKSRSQFIKENKNGL